MPIRLFRATELPPEVPGAIFCDGVNTVILINGAYLGSRDRSAWLREVVNGLLGAVEDTHPPSLLAVS